MKQFLLFLAFSAWAGASLAAIHTVSNNPSTVAQFSTIQSAIAAATDGDTIYVHGSPNAYPGFDLLDKRLVIIGPGWSPDKNLALTAAISGSNTIRNSAAAGSSDGSEFHGLVFTGAVSVSNLGGNSQVNDLVFRRCMFNTSLSFTSFSIVNLLLEGCVFYSTVIFSTAQSYTNVLFQNNMFFFTTCCMSSMVNGLNNSTNVRFDHNLFYSNANGAAATAGMFGSANRFLDFTNNIFNQANAGLNVSLSSFSNNITNNSTLNAANATSNATPWAVNGNIDGGGNISNQNPQMSAQATIDLGNSSPILDFTIASGPADNAASDGKDIGLIFDASSSLNWNNSRNSRLSRIVTMNIVSPTVSAGTNLTVDITAQTSN